MRATLLWLLMVLSANAQEPNLTKEGAVNGRLWNLMPANTKTVYIMGVWDGLLEMKMQTQPACSKGSADIFSRYFNSAGKLTRGEIVEEVDLFFKTPSNRPLSVLNALYYVAAKANGASRQALESIEELMRSTPPN